MYIFSPRLYGNNVLFEHCEHSRKLCDISQRCDKNGNYIHDTQYIQHFVYYSLVDVYHIIITTHFDNALDVAIMMHGISLFVSEAALLSTKG